METYIAQEKIRNNNHGKPEKVIKSKDTRGKII
jgi:hypothetical protein